LQSFTTKNGQRIAYQRAGKGPPLVLLHGFICDSRAWRPQIEELSRDFDVIAWDAPGCGQSSDPPEEFTMAEFADCLADLLDHTDVRSAHLLGLSWGGTLALEFFRLYPASVRSLTLADAYAGWTGSLGADVAAQRLARCLRESELPPQSWVPEWVPEAFSPRVPEQLLNDYAVIMSEFHPVGFRAMSRAVVPDFAETLSQVNAPVLLLWGEADSRSPLTCGQMMRDRIAGARLVVIPNAGHVSNLEQPDLFNAEVRRFVRGVEEG